MGGTAVDTSNPTGKLILNVMSSVAQFEREMMLERQREGIAKAKAEGKYKGRKPTARAKTDMVKLALGQGISKAQICRDLDISKTSSVPNYWGVGCVNLFKLHSDLAERLRLKLGWSHYAIYWVSFIKGVAVTCLGALADVLI